MSSNDVLFNKELTDLQKYNNKLIPNTFDINKLVYIVEFDSNNNVINTTYTNSINYTKSNILTINILIYTYIYIDIEKYYKFKAFNNSNVYINVMELFLNNIKIINFNEPVVLPQNVYLLTIYLKTVESNFILKYETWETSIMRKDTMTTNWIKTVDNLKLTNSQIINEKYLIPHFYLISKEYCDNIENTNKSECLTYNKNLDTNIYNNFISNNIKIQQTPKPIDGKYSDWNLMGAAWDNYINPYIDTFNCGESAIKTRTRTYEPALYGGLDINETPILSEKSIFRTPCYTNRDVLYVWNNTIKCPTGLSSIPDLDKSKYVKYSGTAYSSLSLSMFYSQYARTNLIKNMSITDTSKLTACYGNTSSITVGNTTYNYSSLVVSYLDKDLFPDKSIIYPNIQYKTGYSWTNGKAFFIFQYDKNLKSQLGSQLIWTANSYINDFTNDMGATMQITDNGSFIIKPSTISNTIYFGINELKNIAYGKISPNAILQFYNSKGIIVKQYANLLNKLYINEKYAIGNSWTNGKSTLTFQSNDGSLVLKYNENIEFSTRPIINNLLNSYMEITNNGRINIYNGNNELIWPLESDTIPWATDDKKITFLELNLYGRLLFKNNNDIIYQMLPFEQSRMYPNEKYGVGFTWKNGDYKMIIISNCNFQIIQISTNKLITDSGTSLTNTNIYNDCFIVLQTDGNVVLYTMPVTGQPVWSTATWSGGNLTYNVTYCQLVSTGYLVLFNNTNMTDPFTGGQMVRCFPYLIKSYLNKFYDNSHDLLLMDWANRVFKYNASYHKDSLGNNFYNPETRTFIKTNDYKDPEPLNSKYFGGWDLNYSLNLDKWNSCKRIDLNRIEGYNQETNVIPETINGIYNYYAPSDANTFKKYSGYMGLFISQYPTEIDGKGLGTLANNLPGYDRRSGDMSDNYDIKSFITMSGSKTSNINAFILLYKKNRQDFILDILNIYTVLLTKLKTDSGLQTMLSTTIGPYVSKCSNSYKTVFFDYEIKNIKGNITSTFENKKNNINNITNIYNYKMKSNFIEKLNHTLKENFVSGTGCDLKNILTDINCTSEAQISYKNYINMMNTYCNKEENILKHECVLYQNKEYTDPATTEVFKIDTENKKLLEEKMSDICENNINWSNDACITINYNNPTVIEKQINELQPDSDLYKDLQTKYGNEFLIFECKKNPLDDKCDKLYSDSKYKDTIAKYKHDVCLQEENYVNDKCIEYNINNPESLSSITQFCTENKNNMNCISLYNKVKDNSELQGTDFMIEMQSQTSNLYLFLIIIFVVVFAIVIGYFTTRQPNKRKKNNNSENID